MIGGRVFNRPADGLAGGDSFALRSRSDRTPTARQVEAELELRAEARRRGLRVDLRNGTVRIVGRGVDVIATGWAAINLRDLEPALPGSLQSRGDAA